MKGRSSIQSSKLFKTNQIKTIKKPNQYQTSFNRNFIPKALTNRPNMFKKAIDVRNRLETRSIEEIHKSKPQNHIEGGYKTQQNQQQDGLFAQSHKKIGLIKQTFGTNKLVEFQLSEVLKLIKEEKNKIHETISQLRQASDYYQSLCQFKATNKNNVFVNTEIILHKDNNQSDFYTQQTQTKDNQQQKSNKQLKNQSIEIIESQVQVSWDHNKQISEFVIQTDQIHQTIKQIYQVQISTQMQKWTAECYVQTQQKQFIQQKQQNDQQQKIIKSSSHEKLTKQKSEVYKKLASMLSDMNINYKYILPQEIDFQIQPKDWKNLSETQIIKIQKYFIKKLAQKIPQ